MRSSSFLGSRKMDKNILKKFFGIWFFLQKKKKSLENGKYFVF